MSPDDQGLIPAGHDHDPGQQGVSRYADPRQVIDLREARAVSIGDYNTITNIFRGPGRIAGSAYLDQVRDIAPEYLHDRDEELAILARACWTPDLYDWWRANPWAGKSALLATFVLNPPPSVDIVCFFVTARFSGQANSSVFTEAAARATGMDDE